MGCAEAGLARWIRHPCLTFLTSGQVVVIEAELCLSWHDPPGPSCSTPSAGHTAIFLGDTRVSNFMCRDAMLELGLACDGGKDSLSMAASAGGETVMAPGNLVVSAYAGCPDITLTVRVQVLQVPSADVMWFALPALLALLKRPRLPP